MDIGSIITGVFISLIVWWITNSVFTPKISITNKIVKTPSGRFQIGIQNDSSFRDVCDIYAYIKFCFASGNSYSTKLGQILLLERRQKSKKQSKEDNSTPTSSVVLFIDGYKDPKEKIHTVDDFFESTENKEGGYIDIYVIGQDGFNGSAKKISKARYYYKDISIYSCIKKGTIDVVEISEDFGAQR